MRVVKMALVCAMLVGIAMAGINAAERYPVLRPYVHPMVEMGREFLQADAVVAVAKELLAGPTSESGGAGSGADARRRVPDGRVEDTKKVVQAPPKEMPPKIEVLPAVTKKYEGYAVVCVPGGAYYVPREVGKAVCDDPSLGVPVEEGPKLGFDGIEKRVAEIRERYLAQQRAAAQQGSSQGN